MGNKYTFCGERNGSWLLGNARREGIGGHNFVKFLLDNSYLSIREIYTCHVAKY